MLSFLKKLWKLYHVVGDSVEGVQESVFLVSDGKATKDELKTLHKTIKKVDDDIANFSKNDMQKMAADVGDLVYLCDARGYLGGLKSVHAVYGEPHEEDGVVYINNEHLLNGVFIEGKTLTAEKEM